MYSITTLGIKVLNFNDIYLSVSLKKVYVVFLGTNPTKLMCLSFSKFPSHFSTSPVSQLSWTSSTKSRTLMFQFSIVQSRTHLYSKDLYCRTVVIVPHKGHLSVSGVIVVVTNEVRDTTGQKPRMLFDILQCTEQSPTSSCPNGNINCAVLRTASKKLK